jgi:hypothetical protein
MKTNKPKSKRTALIHLRDERIVALLDSTDPKILGIWARECAGRVLPYFEEGFPNDPRPHAALDALQAWIDTGQFSMAVIRRASLDAHAAAREVGADNPARSAARAAGQAVGTAHVRHHAIGAAMYALQAIERAKSETEAEDAIAREREWQFQRLESLRERGDGADNQ